MVSSEARCQTCLTPNAQRTMRVPPRETASAACLLLRCILAVCRGGAIAAATAAAQGQRGGRHLSEDTERLFSASTLGSTEADHGIVPFKPMVHRIRTQFGSTRGKSGPVRSEGRPVALLRLTSAPEGSGSMRCWFRGREQTTLGWAHQFRGA